MKYVPEVTSSPRFSATHQVVREASEGTLNELDEHAVEAAMRLAAANSSDDDGAEVIAITMAPEIGDLALRKAFQMGVSRGIRLTDPALADSDGFGTTAALAAAVRKLGAEAPVDLVVTGISSSDGATGVLAALMANELGWPLLSLADSVAQDGDTLTITRHIDDAVETLRAPLPAVLSVTDAANTPRTPNFKAIMAARKAPIEAWSLADLDIDQIEVGGAGSRIAVVETSQIPPKPPAPTIYDDGAGSGAAALVEFLSQKGWVSNGE